MSLVNYVNYARQILVHQLVERDLTVAPELTNLYLLLVLTHGRETTERHVHDAWAIWQDQRDPYHRSLVPFDQLHPNVQALDQPFRDAIRDAAAVLKEVPL